jgi:hypothetical protein
MIDFRFVLTNPYPSNKFAFLSDLRRRVDLGLRGYAAPRAFTSGAPHPRPSTGKRKYRASLTTKQVLMATLAPVCVQRTGRLDATKTARSR